MHICMSLYSIGWPHVRSESLIHGSAKFARGSRAHRVIQIASHRPRASVFVRFFCPGCPAETENNERASVLATRPEVHLSTLLYVVWPPLPPPSSHQQLNSCGINAVIPHVSYRDTLAPYEAPFISTCLSCSLLLRSHRFSPSVWLQVLPGFSRVFNTPI